MFFAEFCYASVPSPDGNGAVRASIRFAEQQQFIVFTFVSVALAVISLFYRGKFRMQIRICTLDILILTGYQVWILLAAAHLREVYSMTVFTFFPILAIILLYLAIRFLEKDELLGYVDELAAKKRNRKKTQREMGMRRRRRQ